MGGIVTNANYSSDRHVNALQVKMTSNRPFNLTPRTKGKVILSILANKINKSYSNTPNVSYSAAKKIFTFNDELSDHIIQKIVMNYRNSRPASLIAFPELVTPKELPSILKNYSKPSFLTSIPELTTPKEFPTILLKNHSLILLFEDNDILKLSQDEFQLTVFDYSNVNAQ